MTTALSKIWKPGDSLSHEYPEPSPEQLCARWSEYTGHPAFDLGCYGTYSVPAAPPIAVASIDLCEVLRETCISIRAVTGYNDNHRCSKYGLGTWFDADIIGKERNDAIVTAVAQASMHFDLVEPNEDHHEIASIMRTWRSLGIMCVANTATLPGCEMPTIEHTLQKFYLDCFDALLLPRSDDSVRSISKAEILKRLMLALNMNVSVLHIDDSPTHIKAFLNEFDSKQIVGLFAPAHTQNESIPNHIRKPDSLSAFHAANKVLKMLISA